MCWAGCSSSDWSADEYTTATRDNSLDSRVQPEAGGVGYVPAENLVGRAEFLFFSTDGSARLWEFWNWPFAVRYGRLLDVIR